MVEGANRAKPMGSSFVQDGLQDGNIAGFAGIREMDRKKKNCHQAADREVNVEAYHLSNEACIGIGCG
jgi:hypothetical protein